MKKLTDPATASKFRLDDPVSLGDASYSFSHTVAVMEIDIKVLSFFRC
jgi:hypothetical protein